MNVLGSCVIPFSEQRRLVEGASIDLPRERLMPKIVARAKIGDLIWAKEPWRMLKSRRFGPQGIREPAVGAVGTNAYSRLPPRVRAVAHLLRSENKRAEDLPRCDSRATLEIMSIGEHAVRVLVHMQQVDAFLKARAPCG
jgi:hypothetical protein